MAYRDEHSEDDDEEAELDEREEPDASDVDDEEEGDSATLPCPFCGKGVYEGADVCPHCRNFVSFGGEAGRKPWWVVAAAVALLAAMLLWVVWYV